MLELLTKFLQEKKTTEISIAQYLSRMKADGEMLVGLGLITQMTVNLAVLDGLSHLYSYTELSRLERQIMSDMSNFFNMLEAELIHLESMRRS